MSTLASEVGKPEAAVRPLTLREAILEGIREEMQADPAVVVIGQDVRAFEGPLKSTEGLWAEFGSERVIQTPICESSATSLGVGAALGGLRPIVEIMFTDLLPVAAPPLIQLAGSYRYLTGGAAAVPMVIRARGGDGPYRAHPQNYEALFAHASGLTVVMPSSPADGKGLIKSAIRSNDPVLFIENIFLYNAPRDVIPAGEHLVPLGKARSVREGRDITLVTYGRGVRTASTAARRLAGTGIELEIIDLRTVAPYDEAAVLTSVERTGRLMVLHEAWVRGGLGAEIVARTLEQLGRPLLRPPVRLGAPPVPIPWAEPLRDAMLPSADAVVRAAGALMA
jgi:pyruvate/2-oxoglutarate/acetoin dehydrogenase E1 component